MIAAALAGSALVVWLAVALAPWRPWSTRERLEPAPGSADLSQVQALVPARDEASRIDTTLAALAAQGSGLAVILVDDESGDGTAERALAWAGGGEARTAGLTLEVIRGRPLPEGWSGKVWAQHQAEAALDRPLTVLLDADIRLAPGMLRALLVERERTGAGLVSVMAHLPAGSFWARILLPAFIYFFKLLYPFALANGPGRRVAAAAGGCMLIETGVLRRIGGFAAIRDALIDDCALARAVKNAGARTWVGLTRGAVSQRPQHTLAAVWAMVGRTAFTQLRYSAALLAACTALMIVAYVGPWWAIAAGDGASRTLGVAALGVMLATYLPVVRYHGLAPAWVAGLVLAGPLYLAMTWSSAIGYWLGRRSHWRGRRYATRAGAPGS